MLVRSAPVALPGPLTDFSIDFGLVETSHHVSRLRAMLTVDFCVDSSGGCDLECVTLRLSGLKRECRSGINGHIKRVKGVADELETSYEYWILHHTSSRWEPMHTSAGTGTGGVPRIQA